MLRAQGAHSKFWESQFFEITYNSYKQYKPQNEHLELPYVVKNTFSRTAGARRARSESLPWHDHFYNKTVPTSYRTPASVHTHPNGCEQNIYYYIDKVDFSSIFAFFCVIDHNFLFNNFTRTFTIVLFLSKSNNVSQINFSASKREFLYAATTLRAFWKTESWQSL